MKPQYNKDAPSLGCSFTRKKRSSVVPCLELLLHSGSVTEAHQTRMACLRAPTAPGQLALHLHRRWSWVGSKGEKPRSVLLLPPLFWTADVPPYAESSNASKRISTRGVRGTRSRRGNVLAPFARQGEGSSKPRPLRTRPIPPLSAP